MFYIILALSPVFIVALIQLPKLIVAAMIIKNHKVDSKTARQITKMMSKDITVKLKKS